MKSYIRERKLFFGGKTHTINTYTDYFTNVSHSVDDWSSSYVNVKDCFSALRQWQKEKLYGHHACVPGETKDKNGYRTSCCGICKKTIRFPEFTNAYSERRKENE